MCIVDYKGARMGMRKQFRSVAKFQVRNDDGFSQIAVEMGKMKTY